MTGINWFLFHIANRWRYGFYPQNTTVNRKLIIEPALAEMH